MAARHGDPIIRSVLARRTFLKLGLGGSLILTLARIGNGAFGATAPTFRLLDERSAGLIRALAPVILGSALPRERGPQEAALSAIATSFDRMASTLAPAVQKEIADLLGFLDFAPTRVAFARLWTPVADCSPDELRAFLTRWRDSRFELQQASYQALTQLIHASWYDTPEAWGAIGYPGPPSIESR